MTPVGVRQVSRQFALCTGLIFDGAPGDHSGPGPMQVSLFNIVLPRLCFADIHILLHSAPNEGLHVMQMTWQWPGVPRSRHLTKIWSNST